MSLQHGGSLCCRAWFNVYTSTLSRGWSTAPHQESSREVAFPCLDKCEKRGSGRVILSVHSCVQTVSWEWRARLRVREVTADTWPSLSPRQRERGAVQRLPPSERPHKLHLSPWARSPTTKHFKWRMRWSKSRSEGLPYSWMVSLWGGGRWNKCFAWQNLTLWLNNFSSTDGPSWSNDLWILPSVSLFELSGSERLELPSHTHIKPQQVARVSLQTGFM